MHGRWTMKSHMWNTYTDTRTPPLRKCLRRTPPDGVGDRPEKKRKPNYSKEELEARARIREQKARKLFASEAPKIREEKDYAGMVMLVFNTLSTQHRNTSLTFLPPKVSKFKGVEYLSFTSTDMGLGKKTALKVNPVTGEVVTMSDEKLEKPVNVLDITIEDVLAIA